MHEPFGLKWNRCLACVEKKRGIHVCVNLLLIGHERCVCVGAWEGVYIYILIAMFPSA